MQEGLIGVHDELTVECMMSYGDKYRFRPVRFQLTLTLTLTLIGPVRFQLTEHDERTARG